MDFRVQMAKDVGQTVDEAAAKCGSAVLEPKYDGWRCIVIRHESGVDIYNPSRNSDPSKCYTGKLPELEADLAQLPVGTILDGELVAMEVAEDGVMTNDFYRIHTVMRSNTSVPAQRKGIKLIAFDCIATPEGREIAGKKLPQRRLAVQALISRCAMVEMTIQLDATQENHDALVYQGFEGTVIKCVEAKYGFGKRGHGWFKVKNTRTIDCVVMAMEKDGKGQHAGKVGKMQVGQYKDGVLTRVCSVNCLNDKQRNAATANPEQFLGKTIEVKIYGVEESGAPRHPTPLRFRTDKTPQECLWDLDGTL